jgi:HAD superfamily hydrolase (TIGR01484 family)
MRATPLPLHVWPLEQRRRILGVFTDIDDTLTTEGAITPSALQALTQLRDAGLLVVAITGRPVGWSEPFAARWPLHAIVAENGAVALIPTGDGRVQKRYRSDEATRRQQFARLQEVLEAIEAQIPGAHRAQDSAGRETDIAIDHSEFAHLDAASIDAVVHHMRAEGLHATISSIHINGWLGDHHKRVGAEWIVRELWNRELELERDHWAFIGDSSNDALMFEYVPHSIGVANIARFLPSMSVAPRYLTQAERGEGFAEFVQALLNR